MATYNSPTVQQWPEEVSAKPRRGWGTAVFRGVHFWVPLIVLFMFIAGATMIFVGLGALARIPRMEIHTGWLGLFAAALVAVLAVGVIVPWRITKFT